MSNDRPSETLYSYDDPLATNGGVAYACRACNDRPATSFPNQLPAVPSLHALAEEGIRRPARPSTCHRQSRHRNHPRARPRIPAKIETMASSSPPQPCSKCGQPPRPRKGVHPGPRTRGPVPEVKCQPPSRPAPWSPSISPDEHVGTSPAYGQTCVASFALNSVRTP